MAPAIQLVMEHRDVTKLEIARIQKEIDTRHEQMKVAQDEQDAAVKKLRETQVEFRAYERLLSTIRGPLGAYH